MVKNKRKLKLELIKKMKKRGEMLTLRMYYYPPGCGPMVETLLMSMSDDDGEWRFSHYVHGEWRDITPERARYLYDDLS